MSQFYSQGAKEFEQTYSKSIISTRAFNNEFYTYATSLNTSFATVGTFTLVSGATATTCPANRVLHLTGRKLYPNTNPMNTFVGVLRAPKFLVSVYDPISFLTGFIDPTSTSFTKFDQNVPNFFDLGTQGSGNPPPMGGQGSKLGVGPITTATGNVGFASAGQATTAGTSGSSAATITSFAYNSTSSLVVLTPGTAGLTQLYYTNNVGSPSTFTISTVGATAATVNWLIIN